MLLPPIALIAVVSIAIGGRMSGRGTTPQVAAPVIVAAEARSAPSVPTATPSPRSDWPVEWWRVYDERAEWSRGWSAPDTTPPWVRRLQGLSNFRTDPYQR